MSNDIRSDMKRAIILAAGLGLRLRSLTNNLPKCLVKVNGKSILINQLECLEKNGMEETIVVVGYMKDKIIDKIGGKFGNMRISYVVNNIFDKTNNIYSLWLARDYLQEGCILIESDIMFEEEVLKRVLNSPEDDLSVLAKFKEYMDGVVVNLNSDKTIKNIIFKKEQFTGFNYTDIFKTVNIHKFSKTFAEKFLVPYLDSYISNDILREYYEIVLKEIINKEKLSVYGLLVDDLKWFEIDTMEDLKMAEQIFKE